MDALPQAPRPSFKPKVVALYEQLFKVLSLQDMMLTKDFIAEDEPFAFDELFLLQPHPAQFAAILSTLDGNDFSSIHNTTQRLFSSSVDALQSNDESKVNNALVTLRVFLSALLGRRYHNFSSDIILLLTGLGAVDKVFGTFVNCLDELISSGPSEMIRSNSVRLTLTVVCGSYQSSLLAYFMYNDIFTSLVTYISSSTSTSDTLRASILLALLSTYNKYETVNPYQSRLRDSVNETLMLKIIDCVGTISRNARETYTTIQDDTGEGLLGGVSKLVGSYVPYSLAARLGLGGSRTPTPPQVEDVDEALGRLPDPETAILLMPYEFSHANKAFSLIFLKAKAPASVTETPFGSFLSLTSYLTTQQSRSLRSTLYSRLALLMIRNMVDDSSLMAILHHEDTKSRIRICRQRQPFLPVVTKERKLVEGLIDICVGGIDHNLRRRLDVELYLLLLTIISKVIHYNRRARTRLSYHWNELWRSLLGLLKFLLSKSDDLTDLLGINDLANSLVDLLAAALSGGDTFLPGTADYDDLFYKLVQSSGTLETFSTTYFGKRHSPSMTTLLSVCKHYQSLLSEHQRNSKSRHLSSEEVTKVIKEGYDSIQIAPSSPQAAATIDGGGARYKEGEHRGILKKIWRICIADGTLLLERSDGV